MRLLKQSEKIKLIRQLNKNWGIKTDYWIPLSKLAVDKEVIFYPQDYFLNIFSLERLQNLISNQNFESIYSWRWEIKDHENLIEIGIGEISSFKKDSLEKYYFDNSFEWVVYMSHENTIAIGGSSIIKDLKQLWSEWEQYVNKWYAE